MSRPATPIDGMRAGLALWRMAVDAQAVVGLRVMGMAGLWAVAPGETTRMVTEKAPAFAEAQWAAWAAAMRGERPDEVMSAWVAPISRTAGANARRLWKRGPTRG
ncbi:antifreeze protein [Tranquillimonas alkanivorans]|uniref:Antifreeze protein n=1 Tax=Tranquillimonas alkanivorans TaxID=441119 RepID=A0A1I5R6Q4_9RHOB|nr:antifreeze protein [Tranquillimonas alkanivorans]SFP54208.1 hypothetical protein SAMN04488047_10822 [Tranquillimonas alkanivorans]